MVIALIVMKKSIFAAWNLIRQIPGASVARKNRRVCSRPLVRFVAIAWILLAPGAGFAAELKVAVASNFRHTMQALKQQFEAQSEHQVSLIFASSGKLYAQIQNGAPFDVFFSADEERPRLLVQNSFAIRDSRFTYAIGRLALCSSIDHYVDPGGEILEHGDFDHLAIANPRHAP